MLTALILSLSAFAIILSDQAVKAVIIRRLPEGGRVRLAGGSGLRRVTNTRPRWPSLSPRVAVLAWLALAAGHGVLLALGWPLLPVTAVGLGLVLGGAAGNLVDRLARGGVVDYLCLGRWPAFNLADAAMVAGVALVAAQVLAGWRLA